MQLFRRPLVITSITAELDESPLQNVEIIKIG